MYKSLSLHIITCIYFFKILKKNSIGYSDTGKSNEGKEQEISMVTDTKYTLLINDFCNWKSRIKILLGILYNWKK